ncbi:MAG: hypothetical protein KR126chlam6_01428 [Candidatus Anoxychlamydiales bacterium]|nr:hypothetical protein [Candidatus Anoxychlamydiales bacterium]
MSFNFSQTAEKKMSEDIFLNNLNLFYKEKKISKKYLDILTDFYKSYIKAEPNISKKEIIALFDTLLKLIAKQLSKPFNFDLYHKKITKPFNYQQFGIDFIKPLVDFKNSKLYGLENLKKINKYIEKKENVILLSNHQSEIDPQLINILMPKEFLEISSNIISVAGERVVIDPLAIPFSMGCNLLCIYSKRYLNVDMAKKHQRQIHNKKVMSLMRSLLSEGSKTIYVAPSGGRDRKNEKGIIEIAPFDPQSLEMFYLMGKKAKKATHFFPLCLATYDVMPPPKDIQIEMGEKRVASKAPIFISFLDELDMMDFTGNTETNKIKKRKNRAKYIHNIVQQEYERITKG